MQGLLLILIGGFILSNCSNNSDKTTSIKTDTTFIAQLQVHDYSLVISSNDSIFLFSSAKLNKSVTLIDFQNKKILSRKTEKYLKSSQVGGSMEFITIVPKDTLTFVGLDDNKSKDSSSYDLAIISDSVKEIDFIETKLLENKKLINSYDSIIQKQKLLEYYMGKRYGKEPLVQIKDFVKKKLEYFEFDKNPYYILSYQTADNKGLNADGCKFIIMNNVIKYLAGPCSFSDLYVYTINKANLFIATGECIYYSGGNAREIYEIKNDSLIQKYIDWSFSN